MRRLITALVVAALAIWSSPESLLRLAPAADSAEAKIGARGGGFAGRPQTRPSGAKVRPVERPRPSQRPTTLPAQRPVAGGGRPNRPEWGGGGRPNRPEWGGGGNRPPGARPPGQRPPGARPPGYRPPAARPPAYRPPAYRPPAYRPPAARPPHYRPPGYRPPHWRPPSWRPPYYRPPYYRPPHYRWGSYYWYPRWGWYFTAAVAGATLVYVATLPDDKPCEKVNAGDETLYVCDGVLYRPTYYKDELVYEIASDDTGGGGGASAPAPAVPVDPTAVIGLARTSPLTVGAHVRALQNALVAAGYDVGGVDGAFGSGTETALRNFQRDNGLTASGVVDAGTAAALGF